MTEIILNEDQKRIVKINPNGVMIIKGVAGSGKTTVAVERFSNLLQDHCGEGEEATVISYTNSLTKYMHRLFQTKEFLGVEKLNIQLIYDVYKNYLKRNDRYIIPIEMTQAKSVQGSHRKDLLYPIYEHYKAKFQKSIVFSQDIQFVLDEFEFIQSNICDYVPKDRNAELQQELEEYMVIVRSGRPIRNFQVQARVLIWDMYKEYLSVLRSRRIIDYPTFYYSALKFLKRQIHEKTFIPMFKYMVIDEAQDLSKVQMNFLIHLWDQKADNSNLIIICDVAQRIYKNQYTWREVGVDAVGHSYILRKNYRNTVEIAKAAAEVLKQNPDVTKEEDFINPEFSTRHGMKPVLHHFIHWYEGIHAKDYSYEERKYICDKIGELLLLGEYTSKDMVIVSPTKKYLSKLQEDLSQRGYPTQIISGNKDLINTNCIALCTMHSVKGLEFPVVWIAGANSGFLGKMPMDEANAEENKTQLKLLYTSMTRSKDRLYLSSNSGHPSPFLLYGAIDYSLFAVEEDVLCRPFYSQGVIQNEHEQVRQWFITELVQTYGYSMGHIRQEEEISFGTRIGITDLMVHHKVRQKRVPFIVVEIKSRGIEEGKEQLLSYFSAKASVKYGIWTNGYTLKAYEKRVIDGQISLCEIKDLPTYTQIEEREVIELPFSKEKNIPIIRVNPFDRLKPRYMIPIRNYTAAGSPVDSQETYFGQIFIPEEFAKHERIEAAYIKGDSMLDIGIEDSSVVLIQKKAYPRSNEIGVCVIRGEYGYGATCKKIQYENGSWRLISMNESKKYEDIVVEDMQYIGEVVGIYVEECE